jgi:hypothetical protein
LLDGRAFFSDTFVSIGGVTVEPARFVVPAVQTAVAVAAGAVWLCKEPQFFFCIGHNNFGLVITIFLPCGK